jgi:hypothetical protein
MAARSMTDDEIILRYMLWGFDESPYRVLSNRMVVTRKPSTCAICFQRIPVGSRVRAQGEVFENKAQTFRLCEPCCTAVVSDHADGHGLHMELRTQIGMGMASDAVDPVGELAERDLSTRDKT